MRKFLYQLLRVKKGLVDKSKPFIYCSRGSLIPIQVGYSSVFLVNSVKLALDCIRFPMLQDFIIVYVYDLREFYQTFYQF